MGTLHIMPLSSDTFNTTLVQNLDSRVARMQQIIDELCDLAEHNPALYARYEADATEAVIKLSRANSRKWGWM